MKAQVIRAFMRNNEEVRPGQTFECDRNEYNKWLALGFVRGYETKVEPAAKKKPLSESAPVVPASRKKTPRRSRKSATKSSE